MSKTVPGARAHPLDARWLAAHPLPLPADGTDKNARGRVLAIGGSAGVPGGLLLSAEAALRVGAGKIQLATIASLTPLLGVAMPEAGAIALPERDGEIAAGAIAALADTLKRCDAVLLGPAIGDTDVAGALARDVLAREGEFGCVLDAAAVAGATDHADALRARGSAILTPHHGEMAALLRCPVDAIAAHPEDCARETAFDLDAIVVLKGGATWIAAPDGRLLRYPGGGVGLGTGGSGDVLAGAIAGLLARGADPFEAAARGVWLHGEAGRLLARRAPIGFLARELPAAIARLLVAANAA